MTIKVSTTKPMGHNQRQYAINRIDTLRNVTSERICLKYPVPKPTYNDIVRLAKAGKLPLKRTADMKRVCEGYRGDVQVTLSYIFDEDAIAKLFTETPAYKKAAKGCDEAVRKWHKECDDAKDMIMLGDSELAMKTLCELEAYEV
jgi:hypothetical protein